MLFGELTNYCIRKENCGELHKFHQMLISKLSSLGSAIIENARRPLLSLVGWCLSRGECCLVIIRQCAPGSISMQDLFEYHTYTLLPLVTISPVN